jgi:hypothetical protein
VKLVYHLYIFLKIIKSKIVLEQIKTFVGFGQIYNRPDQTCEYKISSLTNINHFIAKFKEAQILGAKALDYLDFLFRY